jgi:hypothetical protein
MIKALEIEVGHCESCDGWTSSSWVRMVGVTKEEEEEEALMMAHRCMDEL